MFILSLNWYVKTLKRESRKNAHIDKSEVDFLVTEEMVPETRHILEKVFPLVDDILQTVDNRRWEDLFRGLWFSAMCL